MALEVLLVEVEAGTRSVSSLGVLVAVSVEVVRENGRTTEEHTNRRAVEKGSV